jgi:hypothetical protein
VTPNGRVMDDHPDRSRVALELPRAARVGRLDLGLQRLAGEAVVEPRRSAPNLHQRQLECRHLVTAPHQDGRPLDHAPA